MQRTARLLAFLLFLPFAISAQVTTSSMTGSVKTIKGEPLPGATVSAIHIPTGTVYRVASRNGGLFNIFNMIPGGPYTVTVSFVGFNDEKREDIFLTLGETYNLSLPLSEKAAVLTEVTIATRRGTQLTGKGGSETSIGRDKIANLPTVGRNLTDYLRFSPSVKITSFGGFSFAGQNNRYNSFMIDGATNNDVFGLSDQGTNGGRAGAPPISIDAIDQVVVLLSPYDVSLGNFTGGGINAITRSGSNNLSGSVYYVYRNEDLAGKDPVSKLVAGTINSYTRTKLTHFTNQTYGFRFGGPIIKNKLFYFFNWEKQDDNRPQPFDPSSYSGSYIKNDSLNVLINFLKNNYNYDPGDYINNPDLIKGNRFASRIDWNVNEKNQLTFSYRYTKLQRTNPSRSSLFAINFFNNAEFFPSTTNSGTLELNSRISNITNNKLRLTFTNVVDDRGITGTPFPGVTIRDGGANINFGSEVASSANLLKQSIFNFYDAFKYTAGINTLTFGADVDLNKTFDLFINRNYGLYEYLQMGDFILNRRPIRLRRGYSLVDNGKSGDNAVNSSAQFQTTRAGFFVSDDIKVNDNFTLTLGIRIDKTEFLNAPITDQFFRDTGSAVISQFYDLKGAQVGKMYKPSWMPAPRIGFRYTIPDENITLRGGIGVFSGRIPLVWPGGGYQNTGVTVGAFDLSNPNITFRQDVNNQYTASDFGLSRIIPQGELNLVARNFKMPEVMRSSLSIDKRLGNGWTVTMEGMFTKNIYEVDWKNVLLNPNAVVQINSVPGDNRMVYDPSLIALNSSTRNGIKIPLRPYLPLSDIGRSPYTSIILIQNTDGRKGYSYNFTFTIDKAFRNGWFFNANYAYGNSTVRNEGTSSINSSNWNNMEAVNGRNYLDLTTSTFDLGHRITAYVSKKLIYANKMFATTISLDYTGQSGQAFSYTMTGNINGDGNNFNDLMYVPTQSDLAAMLANGQFLNNTSNGVTYTPAQQVALFDAYIQNDRYLKKRRGKYAERNGGRLPFTNILNLRLQQDFNFKFSGRTYAFQVIYDMFNFTNFLNHEWGRQYFANFNQAQVVGFAGFKTGTSIPTYRFLPVTTPNGLPFTVSDGISPFLSSRWTSQITLRINF